MLWLQFQKIQIQQQKPKQKNVRRLWWWPYGKVLDVFINVTSPNRGCRTVHHSVATYEQTKKGMSYFYPKEL